MYHSSSQRKLSRLFAYNQEGRGSTRWGKNYAHNTSDPTEVSWYVSVSYSLICSSNEGKFDPLPGTLSNRRNNCCELIFIVFKRAEPIFVIGLLLGRKKTPKVDFTQNRLPIGYSLIDFKLSSRFYGTLPKAKNSIQN